ncbi:MULTISPECIES: MFS transporter [unclassified Nonomuraea]|uniref:MFS transporter n=1 Tax=unclassified Nonomuraea TaxID=2593643 RepID=UPI0033F63E00
MISTSDSDPAARHRSRGHHRASTGLPLLRLITAAVTALVMADMVATTLALPVLGSDPITRAVPLSQLSLLSSINMAAIAALLATAGRLADLLGRRAVLTAGLVLFAVGALACAFAPSWAVLLGGRLAQGVGAALMMPASLGLLLSHLREHQHRGAMALWGAATGGGALVMHALGGLVLTGYGWRTLYLSSGMCALGLLLLTVALPRIRATDRRMPDLLGMLALAGATTALVLVISYGSRWGWTSMPTMGGLAASAAAAGLAVARSRRHPAGAIDLGLRSIPGMGWAWLTALLYGLMSVPVLVIAPIMLREDGLGPVAAGLALAPMSAMVMLASPLASRLARRIGVSWTVYAGAFVTALGGLALIPSLTPSAWALGASAVLGLGFGTVTTPAMISGTLAVTPGRYATAVGSVITARMLGGALGPTVATAYLAHVGPQDGYQGVLAGCVIVALALAACALVRATRQARRRVRPAPRAALVAALPAAGPRTAAQEELQRLREVLVRQRARFEAIAHTAETELAALSDPSRVRFPRGGAHPMPPLTSIPEARHDHDRTTPLPVRDPAGRTHRRSA